MFFYVPPAQAQEQTQTQAQGRREGEEGKRSGKNKKNHDRRRQKRTAARNAAGVDRSDDRADVIYVAREKVLGKDENESQGTNSGGDAKPTNRFRWSPPVHLPPRVHLTDDMFPSLS
jgi:hypothetical protein